MNQYIVTFGFNGEDGYQLAESTPIPAVDENEASVMLKDRFEMTEGYDCDIIEVKKLI